MKRLLIIAFTITVLMSVDGLSQLCRRSARTLPKGKFILWLTSAYYDLTRKYNFATDEWEDLQGDNLKVLFQSMYAFGLSKRWEIMVDVPWTHKESTSAGTTFDSSGVGDVVLQTRYNVSKGTKRRPWLTFTGAVRFPTGDKTAKPILGYGTTDFGVGFLILSPSWSSKIGKFKGHIKVAHWFNGKMADDTNLGDRLEYVFKLDCSLSKKFMGFLCLKGYFISKNKDAQGSTIANTEKSRFVFMPGFVWKPIKNFNVKPRIAFTLAGVGGKAYVLAPLVDFWLVF